MQPEQAQKLNIPLAMKFSLPTLYSRTGKSFRHPYQNPIVQLTETSFVYIIWLAMYGNGLLTHGRAVIQEHLGMVVRVLIQGEMNMLFVVDPTRTLPRHSDLAQETNLHLLTTTPVFG